MQLFELQHYENHVAKKYADTNNNRLSQASLMIYITLVTRVVSKTIISELSITPGRSLPKVLVKALGD